MLFLTCRYKDPWNLGFRAVDHPESQLKLPPALGDSPLNWLSHMFYMMRVCLKMVFYHLKKMAT